MKIPFKDLLQLSKDHAQVWPADLADDLEEEEPQISQQAQMYNELILQHIRKREEEAVPSEAENPRPTLPTLVVPGWNCPSTKGTKNWSDFENLLLFYTIGKLASANTPENYAQKEKDLNELRKVIEDFLPLKGQKRKSAEDRVQVNTTYLAFGKNVIDGLVCDNPSVRYEAEREIQDARETNYYNAQKLEKSYGIARRVFKKLKERYN